MTIKCLPKLNWFWKLFRRRFFSPSPWHHTCSCCSVFLIYHTMNVCCKQKKHDFTWIVCMENIYTSKMGNQGNVLLNACFDHILTSCIIIAKIHDFFACGTEREWESNCGRCVVVGFRSHILTLSTMNRTFFLLGNWMSSFCTCHSGVIKIRDFQCLAQNVAISFVRNFFSIMAWISQANEFSLSES